MVALFVDPFSLAFAQYPGLYPPAAPDPVFTVICTLLYACDVTLNFLVAYYEDGVLVTDLHRIAGGCLLNSAVPCVCVDFHFIFSSVHFFYISVSMHFTPHRMS
jgi:hypothetical protein